MNNAPNDLTEDQKAGYSVLIVEDNDDDRDLCVRALQRALAELGIELRARAVADGTQGSAQIRLQRFDAIFLDCNLPPPDGVELTRLARASKLNQATPVIMITGAEDRGLMSRAFQAGVTVFLFKPLDRVRIQRLVALSRPPIERERRKLQRVKVTCKVVLDSEKGRLEGETLDLSLGGMLVAAKSAWPVGQALSVALTLPPGGQPLRLNARVARVTAGCMGLELERVGKAETEKLADFLVAHLAHAIEPEPTASK